MVNLRFSLGSWSKAQKAQEEPGWGESSDRLWDDPENKSRHPTQAKENSDTRAWVFASFQPALRKTSSTHLFHSEGSSSWRSTFISSNTFWAFTNSSSALTVEKKDCQLQCRQAPCRAVTTVTLSTSLGDQAKFWHGVILIPNESPGRPDAPSGFLAIDFPVWIFRKQFKHPLMRFKFYTFLRLQKLSGAGQAVQPPAWYRWR